ncbi:hypothetical protein VUJ46_07025 [Chryseobacterium sp. MYb264]|nr:hypothetical protein VUJ46_07025 [Chryseobacterium sp. MYb264]
MSNQKLLEEEIKNVNIETKKDDEKEGKLLLKVLQIVIGIIMAAFHI